MAKKKVYFTKESDRKLGILLVVIFLVFACLGIQLYVIVDQNKLQYQKKVLSQLDYSSSIIPSRRGDIYDANGNILAVSEKVYAMIIDASVITYQVSETSPMRYYEPTIRTLRECFPDMDIDKIKDYIDNNKDSAYYIAAKNLTYEDIKDILRIKEENDFVRGVWFEESYKRHYPYKNLASSAIGFTSGDGNGIYGLEEYYNDYLNGTDGRSYGYLSDSTELQRTTVNAIDGYNIYLTIDTNIQTAVEKNLREFNENNKDAYHEGNGAENVACIVMGVNSGEVLAMAEYPDFDLNDPRNTKYLIGSNLVIPDESLGYLRYEKTNQIITPDVLNTLTREELYANYNSLWSNFCVQNTYEPGSTIKPFTVAAALETGSITGNEVYNCNGAMAVADHTIKCHSYKTGGEGEVSVKNAVAWSCNVALMNIGLKLGNENFAKFQKLFGFGLKTNIDMTGETKTDTVVYTAEQLNPSELATCSFGQGFNVSMIQLITGFCSLINGGNYYEPHMVSKIVDNDGNIIKNVEPRVLKRTISESTSAKIREYCEAVVMEDGGAGTRRTGKTALPEGYRIGGKSGTAETLPRGNGEYVVSFVGYAPTDNPEVAIYVVVDRPNTSDQENARYATYLVRDILADIFPYLNIYPETE